jgi:hypothetical protein
VNFNAFLATAWNGFREARRNRVTVVVGVFALLTLLLATLVTQITVVTFRRVMVDTGLGLMSLILVFLSIFLSSGLLAREIERRTIVLVVTKPISRSTFLARFAGTSASSHLAGGDGGDSPRRWCLPPTSRLNVGGGEDAHRRFFMVTAIISPAPLPRADGVRGGDGGHLPGGHFGGTCTPGPGRSGRLGRPSRPCSQRNWLNQDRWH